MPRDPSIDDLTERRVRELWAQRRTCREIGEAIGVPEWRVWRLREELGLPPRKVHEAQRPANATARPEVERLPWPDDWLNTRDADQTAADARLCTRLWAEVLRVGLIAAIDDAVERARPPQSAETLFWRGWIATADAAEVMQLAGLDPAAARDRLTAIVVANGLDGLLFRLLVRPRRGKREARNAA